MSRFATEGGGVHAQDGDGQVGVYWTFGWEVAEEEERRGSLVVKLRRKRAWMGLRGMRRWRRDGIFFVARVDGVGFIEMEGGIEVVRRWEGGWLWVYHGWWCFALRGR